MDADELADRCLIAAREKWPGIVTDDDTALRALVRARLGDRVPEYGADLVLALAAVRGDAGATRALHGRIVALAPLAVERVLAASELDEVIQRVSVKILVAGDRPAQLEGYSARGSIDAWLRTVILRTALSMRRASEVERRADETPWLELSVLGADDAAGNALVWQRFAPSLRGAFEAAFAALPTRNRVALRLHFIDGLSADEIGRMYSVHRITAYRWIADAKLSVLANVRERVAEVTASASELDSVLRGVRSKFSITVERVLGKNDPF